MKGKLLSTITNMVISCMLNRWGLQKTLYHVVTFVASSLVSFFNSLLCAKNSWNIFILFQRWIKQILKQNAFKTNIKLLHHFWKLFLYCSCYCYIVGNKAKRANLKTEVTRKQNSSKFPKNEHFVPPDTHVRVRIRG